MAGWGPGLVPAALPFQSVAAIDAAERALLSDLDQIDAGPAASPVKAHLL